MIKFIWKDQRTGKQEKISITCLIVIWKQWEFFLARSHLLLDWMLWPEFLHQKRICSRYYFLSPSWEKAISRLIVLLWNQITWFLSFLMINWIRNKSNVFFEFWATKVHTRSFCLVHQVLICKIFFLKLTAKEIEE